MRRACLPSAAWVSVLTLACALVTLSGCSQSATKDVGIGPGDVDHVEVYLYSWSDAPDTVTESVVRDRREIEQLVYAFTDIPVTSPAHPASELAGHEAAGLRFILREVAPSS